MNFQDLFFNDNNQISLLFINSCDGSVSNDEIYQYGLASYAIDSGIDTVIAPYSIISDIGAAIFATTFYQFLKTAPIRAEALRQTQLAMLRGEVEISPSFDVPSPNSQFPDSPEDLSALHYWASYTMFGSPW